MAAKETPESMHYKLKELYKQLTLPQVAWMGDRMALPIQKFYVELLIKSQNKFMKHTELFQNTKTKRILVEGLPGYGKTTLATKIAHDWAINEPYTQRFHLVFLITIREIQDKSVIDAIVDLVDISGYKNPNEIRKRVTKNEEKILLILDGLDEVAPNVRDKVLKILYKREMKKCVTCRSGEFNLKPEEGRALFKGLSLAPEFCDELVIILGIQNERKTEFLKTFLHEIQSVDKVIGYFNNLTNPNKEFFDSPLMLLLLAEMVLKDEILEPIISRTSFYKDVINFMIRRSEERRNVFLTKSFNIFGPKNSETRSLQIKLSLFGEMCFQRVWSGNQLEFKEDEIIQIIHKFGLVIHSKKLTNICCTDSYQVYHRTIMEFMAAYYIYQEFLNNNFVFSNHIERKLIEDIVTYGNSSLVTPFLIGLMKEHAPHYFTLMSINYIDVFQQNQIALWRMLMECECVDKVENSIISNLPSDMHVPCQMSLDLNHFYSSELHKRLLKLGTQTGRVNHINYKLNSKMSFPTDIEPPHVSVMIENTSKAEDEECILQHMKCTHCHVKYSRLICSEMKFNSYAIKLLRSIPAKFYTFDGDSEAAINFIQMKSELRKNVQISTLVYSKRKNRFYPKEIQLSMLEERCKLLDTCQINKLVVMSVDGITQILTHCKNVKHLYLSCEKMCPVSMDTLFLDKQWESITLKRIELTLPSINDICICRNLIVPCWIESCVLSKITEISHLECCADTLFELITFPLWPSFQTVSEIVLFVGSNVKVCEFWKCLALFPNIDLLKIRNWWPLDITYMQTDILSNILELNVKKLIVEFPWYFDDAYNFLSNVLISLNNVTVTLKTFGIQISNHALIIKNNSIADKVCLPDIKIEDDFVQKCVEILTFCASKKMTLKCIELHLPNLTKKVLILSAFKT